MSIPLPIPPPPPFTAGLSSKHLTGSETDGTRIPTASVSTGLGPDEAYKRTVSVSVTQRDRSIGAENGGPTPDR